ncbi:MAG: Ppx/GppA phosphatase family protein [Candidatus Rokuibacteriota bacterium]
MNPELTALVDLGSNSVRFMLVRIVPGAGYRVLLDTRAQTRLGSGRDGALAAEAIRETAEAVARFLSLRRREPPSRVLAIATAAVRDAPNAEDLLELLRVGTGLEVTVLSTDEEARLGALAARASLQLRDAVVVDLGGCSLQLSAIRDGEPVALGSLPLGGLRTTQSFFAHDPPTTEELDALRHGVRVAAGDLLPPAGDGEPLIGIGGTARALARLVGREVRRGATQRLRLTLAEVEAMRGRLATLALDERRQFPGLKPSRADVVVAGALVLEELIRLGGYRGLLVAQHGVRHGMLLRETFERVRA